MSKTLGLALGAGGTRGVAHIGFLKALEEADIRPDFIAGSSMGSVVGACYSKGMTCDKMKEEVFGLKALDIIDPGIGAIGKLGLLKSNKVRKLMCGYLENCSFSDLKIPYCCVAVDVRSGRLQCFKEGSVVDAVMASSAMPTVFRPVEKDGMLLIDGGVLCRVPVHEVKALGADCVVAVDVLGKTREVDKISNTISLVTRIYDIMDGERTTSSYKRYRKQCDLWLEPDMPEVSQYKVKNVEQAYDAGYELGKQNVARIKEILKV